MKRHIDDEKVFVALKKMQKAGRKFARAGEIARMFSVDSVAALGAMERVKGRL